MTGPDQPRRRRRLAAILMADVVGFSKMMTRDEQGTVDRILEFHELVESAVGRRGGRVVGTAGDSVFGDFDSIVEAFECAVELQRALLEPDHGTADEDRVVARIGLHLGDVIVDDDDVFGDGVNIAARLEQLAEPGGIAMSDAVYQQVKQHTDLSFEELGTRTLKNIDQPVKVHMLGPEAIAGRSSPSATREERSARVRDAIVSAVDEIAREVKESRPSTDEVDPDDGRGGVDDGFSTGTIVLAAIGVLLVLARTSGWSTNPWYPFVGAFALGIAVGRFIETITSRRVSGLLFQAVGLGIGALYFDAVVARALIWVCAAGILGASIQHMRRRGWLRSQRAPRTP